MWLGISVLLFALYEVAETGFQASRHQIALRSEFARLVAGVASEEPAAPETPAGESAGDEGALPGAATGPAAAAPASPSDPIARIQIPRIGVDVIAVDGVKLEDLAKGPGRYPGSARLGRPGITAFAGHRTGWGSPFLNLDRLRDGDTIILDTPKSVFTYVVRRAVVVEPQDTWVLRGDPRSRADSQLVLTTCTPKFTTKDRLVVFADLTATLPR